MDDKILQVKNVTKRFGGLVAVSEVSMEVSRGSIHALIGPNGSGKSTLLNVINGLYRLTAGEIVFDGKRIDRLNPHDIARLGVGRTFQNIRLFPSMSVVQNGMVGEHFHSKAGLLPTLFKTPNARMEERSMRKKTEKALDFLGLSDVMEWESTSLPYGQQRMLEIARALVMDPQILLLDEPAAGLNPTETVTLMNRIRQINEEGITILLVEHNMRFVMDISDWITVLDFGRVICQGNPEKVKNERCVIEAYLGENTNLDVVGLMR